MITFSYLAGMMDADGHFSWRAGKYQAPDIGVTNTSESLMAALTSTYGGNVALQRRLCLDSCAENHVHRRAAIWKWHLTGFRAVLVCRALIPHLIIKAAQAREISDRYDIALSLMERPRRRIHHMEKEQLWWDSQGWD